jgi:hypothetical protein
VFARAGAPPAASDAAIYLADLERCRPASALSREWRAGCWRLLPYDAGRLAGTMLVSGPASAAPEVAYPLGRSGRHRISLGILAYPGRPAKRVEVKLSRESTFTPLSGLPGRPDHLEAWIDEIDLRTADLTGQDLILRPAPTARVHRDAAGGLSADVAWLDAWIAYIKLVPLTPAQVEEEVSDRARNDRRRVYVHNDAYFHNVTGAADEVRKWIEPLRDTDAARLYWEAGDGDHALYFSKITRDYSRQLLDAAGKDRPAAFATDDEALTALTWRAYRRTGVDPLKTAVDSAHATGLELHAGYRMGGFVYPPEGYDFERGSFFERNRDRVCIARDGTRLPRISYAYPEVRGFVVSLLEEIAAYEVDGICLLYNRRPPILEYEPPLVEGFKARHGKDPRELDEHDPQWLAHRAAVLTEFMREVRAALDRAGRGRRLELSAIVSGTEAENLYYAMDLREWVRNGLVDTLIPYTSAPKLLSRADSWVDPGDARFFFDLTRGTRCKLALNLMPRDLSAAEYRRRAHRLYRAGAEYLFFWDGGERARFEAPRLGHREEIAAWVAAGEPPLARPAIRVRKLGGWDFRLDTPG